MKRITFMMVVLILLLTSVAITNAQGNRRSRVPTHIVVFKDDVNVRANVPDVARAYGLQVHNQYEHVLNGFAAVIPQGRLNALSRDPRIAYIEENMEFTTTAQQITTGIYRSFLVDMDGDVNNIDIDGVDDFRVDVDVAVIDTGVDYQHPDLNVQQGVDCTGGSPIFGNCTPGGDDDQYHGTHVAGTIGALDNDFGVVGVAPGARIYPVKVLAADGSGYTSWIIAGIDWVVSQGNIEVINMSLGGAGISTAYGTAINNAVASGVVVVVAAGNSDADANGYSPAFVQSAITVSALADFDGLAGGFGSRSCRADEDDTLANFSNWGSVVDIAAPGVCITSTFPLERGSYATISGTSMAAPHVAGAAALLASGANSPQNAADVQAIRDALVNGGNYNWTDDSGDGIQEPLLDLTGVSATLIAN